MSGDIQALCNKIVGKTIVSCEVDFESQTIYLEFDDGSLVEISGDNLDVYTEFQELDD
jgi:hypothetical protein